MSYYKWKPSKTAKKEFAIKMQEINDFCIKNHISNSNSNDSYYFTINEKSYRVSNHSIESSKKIYHPNGREKDVQYIHASKTRIIDIYNDLYNGYALNGNGNRLYN